MNPWGLALCLFLGACSAAEQSSTTQTSDAVVVNEEFVDLSKRDKPSPIVKGGWDEVLIQTPDAEDVARLWTDIGGYETVSRNGYKWTVRAPGAEDGYITFLETGNSEDRKIRPNDAKAWDTGCYWSIMMRAKNLEGIIEDARKIGWEPLTDMAYLEFGPSKLNVVVLTHMNTGTRVQLYERLTTPLPEEFPAFERISRPFNIMQMVKDRDQSYDFFQKVLGFETFYYGKPYVSEKEEVMPLGIPAELTTKIPYKVAIVYPEKDMEWGRFEMIEVEGMPGARDFSQNCDFSSSEAYYGTIGVLYEVSDLKPVIERLENADVEFQQSLDVEFQGKVFNTVRINSPDGGLITFSNAQPIPK